MSAVRALSAGVRGAWRAPGVIASGLGALIAAPTAANSSARVGAVVDATLASRAAHAAARRFARLSPARWRNSCLYRSVAECLALRALDLPARVVIGVGASADDVIAHAWVECDGVTCLSTRGQAELETMMARGERRPSARVATP
jgi:hypothetical protein